MYLQDDDDEIVSDSSSSYTNKRTDGGAYARLKYSERVRVLNEIEHLPSVLSSNSPESILQIAIKHIENLLNQGQNKESVRLIVRLQEIEQFQAIFEHPFLSDLKKAFYVLAGLSYF